MKKTYQNFLILSFFLILASCETNLEIEPESFISSDSFYNNEKEVNLAVIATYNSLYKILENEWSVTELRSDNTSFRPDGSPGSDLDRYTIDRFTVSTTNKINENYYRACYSTIALSNRVLQNLSVVGNLNLKKQYEGEARFFRAHAYFNLVRLYGPVPFVDRVLTGEESLKINRSPVNDIYNLIISDLQFASENLPSTYAATEKGRVTKWAAKGILGKVHLTLKNYAAAETVLESILSGPNKLLPKYEDVFKISNEYNDEILFAVRYQSGGIGLGSIFANSFAPLNSGDIVVRGSGSSFNVPTTSISDGYLPADTRKASSMSDFWINATGVKRLNKFVSKYNSAFNTVNDSGNDWPVIRFSDVLLMLSESYAVTKGVVPALEKLNMVRTRVGLPIINESEVATPEGLKLAIENERRFEFAFENHRWFDLVRTGKAVEVINQHFTIEPIYIVPLIDVVSIPNTKPNPIKEWQLLLPIPQYEIDLNPNLSQNLGY
jgi:starch-binding outer membrane protein, SusD/RagB family